MQRLMVLALFAAILFAQPTPREAFERWLTTQAEKLFDLQDRNLSELDSPQAIRQRQQWMRQSALELIGGLPAIETPLNARVTGGFRRKGYRVENVIFESQPGFRVTANLYLPDGPGPFPAVLGVAGHSNNGKASATYQRAWLGFVAQGIAVLAYDPPGQGERLEYLDAATGHSRASIGVGEHQMAGVPTLLVGQSIARHFVQDGRRALDYLLTRREIDPNRIGVAGNSGGGTQAAYLAMFEPRLAAVVSSCYMTSWRELWSGPGPQDAEQLWPGMIATGLDFSAFPLSWAPKPFLIESAIRDYFPIAGARHTHRVVTRIYDYLRSAGNAGFFEFDDTHGWSQPRREAAARWFARHLQGREVAGTETITSTEEESLLYATPTGQLATSLGSRTMRELALDRAKELEAARPALTADVLRRTLQLHPTEPSLPLAQREAGPSTGDIVLLLGVPLEDADSREWQAAGKRVVELNPRGTGPSYGSQGASGYQLDYQLAARAWLLGRSLLEMQTADVLAAISRFRAANPQVRITIHARGRLGPLATVVAALDGRLDRVIVEASLRSWKSMLEAPTQQGWDVSVVPGILRTADLPEIRQLIPPGKFIELAPVHPNGLPIRGSGVRPRGEGWSLARAIEAL